MDVRVSYKKTKNADEAYRKAKQKFDQRYFEQFSVKGSIQTDDHLKKFSASGSGFTFSLCFTEKEAQGTLELSLLLRPMKSSIIGMIEKNLKELL